MPTEARIVTENTVLLALSEPPAGVEHLCGSVTRLADLGASPSFVGKTVYLCGDLREAGRVDLHTAARVFIVADLSYGADDLPWPAVDSGRLPVLVHGAGVYYRSFFDRSIPYFERILGEHSFQSLRESTKPSHAHRKGIYLTPVEREGNDLHFRLLRCSTNLSGPTENFRATDWQIVSALNQEAATVFADHAPLNHVLAQVYHNRAATEEQRQAKAKIKAHADKTKDMPQDGIMAFCTFYDRLDALRPLAHDRYDLGHQQTSGLTRLAFRLKDDLTPNADLPAQFTVTLYPHSVFFMPLSTNRWYTHEIQASTLDAARLPTRLGYVVRCSATEAVHTNGRTLLKVEGGAAELEPPTEEGMAALRDLYAEENRRSTVIHYGGRFRFSMNAGDYLAPHYRAEDEFRTYTLPLADDTFVQLERSARLEDLGEGRQGAVVVLPDPTRGTPIVRTTTRYSAPAQRFSPLHRWLAQQICTAASLPPGFNNALLERYTPAYTTMGAHSDQAQDLEDGTLIALFSCYRDPTAPPRHLRVTSKEPHGGSFSIPLTHHSVVVFSLPTNRRFQHKIVLDRSTTDWIGVTFRTSRRRLRLDGPQPRFEDGAPLHLADDQERQELYRLRGRENRELDFTYPSLPYTLSESDLLPPL